MRTAMSFALSEGALGGKHPKRYAKRAAGTRVMRTAMPTEFGVCEPGPISCKALCLGSNAGLFSTPIATPTVFWQRLGGEFASKPLCMEVPK